MPFSYEKPKWLQLDPWRPGERLLPLRLQIPPVGRDDKVRVVVARSSGQRKKHPLRHQHHAILFRKAKWQQLDPWRPGERLLPQQLQIPPAGRDDKVRVVMARNSGQRKKHPLRHSNMPFSYEKPKWLQLDPSRPGEAVASATTADPSRWSG